VELTPSMTKRTKPNRTAKPLADHQLVAVAAAGASLVGIDFGVYNPTTKSLFNDIFISTLKIESGTEM
jgi:hypothetical protein